jgi:3-hydroxyisobutyrate dehydrogenase
MGMEKIGWIGLGNMGMPMSRQLITAGYDVSVYNRSKDKENVFLEMGVTIASTPLDLINQVDLVFIMVSDDHAVKEIFSGENGLLKATVSGKVMINMSTVSPGVSREMAALCKEKGNEYLDAPVSGSVKQAQDGQLVVMAGGDTDVFEKVKTVLSHLGKMSLLVGNHGDGNTAKLAINSLLASYALGLSETIVFARQHGIKTEDLLNLLGNSAIGNVFSKIKGEAILNDQFKPVFALKHIVKDLNLAKAEGLQTPLARTVLETFKQAEASLGEEDIIAVIKQVEKK